VSDIYVQKNLVPSPRLLLNLLLLLLLHD